MRPGRLDRILYVGPPDLTSREEIFRIKLKGMTVGEDVDTKALAELVCPISVMILTLFPYAVAYHAL